MLDVGSGLMGGALCVNLTTSQIWQVEFFTAEGCFLLTILDEALRGPVYFGNQRITDSG